MKTKILVIAANPQNTHQLHLDREIRAIEEALERSHRREKFVLCSKLAVRIDDLQRVIRQENPRIVHFCGHGTGNKGLVLETASGQQDLVTTEALTDLFKLFSDRLECVVLNACYSEAQAKAINQSINYLIGTKSAIKDNAAIAFSQGFYEALGDGESIERAYAFGCNRIQLKIYGDNLERKFVPVYSKSEKKYINLQQHEVLMMLTKEPLNAIAPIATSPTYQEDSEPKQDYSVVENWQGINIKGGDNQIDSPTLNF